MFKRFEEEKTTQVTVWSDRLEIFLEHRLIVVNAPTKFITHVTDLTTLEPRRERPLTFIPYAVVPRSRSPTSNPPPHAMAFISQSSPSRSRASGSCPSTFPPQDRSTSLSCPP